MTFKFSIKSICCSVVYFRSNIAFPNKSNGLIFLRRSEAVVRRCSSKEIFLTFSKISQETPALEYLNKVKGLQAKNFIKKKLQVFLCEISRIFDIIFFYKTLPVAVSGIWYTKLKYQARVKVIEAFLTKQFCSQSNLKNIAKRWNWDK